MDFSELSNILNSVIRRGVPGNISSRGTSRAKRSKRTRDTSQMGLESADLEDNVSLGEYAFKDVNWDIKRDFGEGADDELKDERDEGGGGTEEGESQGYDEGFEEELSPSLEEELSQGKGEGEHIHEEVSHQRLEGISELPLEEPEEKPVEIAPSPSIASPEMAGFQPLLMDAEEFYGDTLEAMIEEARALEEDQSPSTEDLEGKGIEVNGSEGFKRAVDNILRLVPNYPLNKLAQERVLIEEGSKARVLLSGRRIRISYPSPSSSRYNDWALGLRVLLGIALDKVIGGERFSSLKSPAMLNAINSIRYRGEKLVYPTDITPWKLFAIATALLLTDSSEDETLNLSTLAKRSRTLYDYLISLYKL